MAEEKQGGALDTAFGILSKKDMDSLKQVLPFMSPIVSPWMTLGAGALMGLYGQHEANKDQQRAIGLNAKMAQLSPWTKMGPQQVSFQKPSTLGHVLGGVSAAQGFSDSINQHAPAYNVWKYLRDKEQQVDDANNPYKVADFVGPPTKSQWEAFDPTVNMTIEELRTRGVDGETAPRRGLGEDPYEMDYQRYYRDRDPNKYKGDNAVSPYFA